MGWGSTLYTSLYFNRETFNNKCDVQCRIDELDSSIKMNEDELRDLAMMTDPSKMLRSAEDDNVSAADLVRARFNACMEILKEDIAQREGLLLLLEQWDKCHDKNTGLAIPPPDNWKWDDAFFDGDFVETTDKNTINDLSSKQE